MATVGTCEAPEIPVDLTAHAYKYFGRTNLINKNILSDEKLFKRHLEEQWDNIPEENKNALLDLLFVDEEVRTKYSPDSSLEARSRSTVLSATDGSSQEKTIEESFPRLIINSGQKINVDFDNELWTWRDEHSGPFSWMSRSQQDLTLDDLEQETILKPQPKQLRVDLEDENCVKKATAQFTQPCNSWCHEIIKDFKNHQAELTLTPSPSLDLQLRTNPSAEEVNPAFEGSLEELSTHTSRENSPESGENANPTLKNKDQGRKSVSPQKVVVRSGSFKKSPVKKSERAKEEQLIIKGDDWCVAEAYANPAMESEWSNFVGDKCKAPEAQVMERGDHTAPASPYTGDQIQLLQDSQESRPSLLTSESSDWSVESTPDHKTHLLKGLKSPGQAAALEPSVTSLHSASQGDHHVTREELLTVVMEGSHFDVTSEEVERRDSKIPSTGFDFLDNW